MVRIVLLENADRSLSDQLVNIMNTDIVLAKALGSPQHYTTDDFIKSNAEWSKKYNADIFAILIRDIAIGMISLSHQNITEKTARIGYWIGSQYWGNGYTSAAFKQILCYALQKGFKQVSASIKHDNNASLRIWEQYGAQKQLEEKRVVVTLMLKDANSLMKREHLQRYQPHL